MNRLFLFLVFLLPIIYLDGQIGIKIVGTLSQHTISETVSNEKLFSFKPGLGIDYWFRLKNYRLEILPAVHVHYAREKFVLDDQRLGKLNWSFVDFAPGFQFYPLDFKNDCQCPTFSKQGKFFKKGLFLNLTPGLGLSVLTSNLVPTTKAKDWIGFVRMGLGIDIGLSDLMTFSPSINYQLSQRVNWSPFFQSQTSTDLNINSGLFLTARFGIRLDKERY